jgi:hypothetical protein
MKISICALVLLLISIASQSALAYESVGVPLPGIETQYNQSHVHHAHFELDRIPSAINRVWIHVSGGFSPGEMRCSWGGTYVLEAGFLASMVDTINGPELTGNSHLPPGTAPFDYTTELVSAPGSSATWDFLLVGYGYLTMNMTLDYKAGCWITLYPEAKIEMAELLIEGDFPRAVERSTWGSIRSLYR